MKEKQTVSSKTNISRHIICPNFAKLVFSVHIRGPLQSFLPELYTLITKCKTEYICRWRRYIFLNVNCNIKYLQIKEISCLQNNFSLLILWLTKSPHCFSQIADLRMTENQLLYVSWICKLSVHEWNVNLQNRNCVVLKLFPEKCFSGNKLSHKKIYLPDKYFLCKIYFSSKSFISISVTASSIFS